MKISRLFLPVLVLLCFAINISAQAIFDAKATLSVKEMQKRVKKEKGFVFDDFVKANVHQTAGPNFTQGVIQHQWVNFNAQNNTFYVKQGENVLELNSNSIKGVYSNDYGNFMKCNDKMPNDYCEVIHMTEKIYLYKIKDDYFAKVGGEDRELELTTNALQNTFGLQPGNIEQYITINKLKLNKKEDLKVILQQYEVNNL